MKKNDILIRKGTTNRYKVVFHSHWSDSHWSDIVNIDDPLDIDYVKWIGAGRYVSSNKGHVYFIEKE